MKRFILILAFAGLASALGCGMNAERGILMAAGSYGDIAVVYGDGNLEPVARRFAEELNQELTFVIATETRFKIDIFPADKLDLAKGYKNAVFLAVKGDHGPVGRALRKVISREALDKLAAGAGGLVQRRDPWATYQLLVVAMGPDRNTLGSILHRNAARIRTMIEKDARTRILRHNRYAGLATELMNALWDQYGFYLEVPANFRLTQQGHDGLHGVELMRTGPSRGITITWRETPDPEARLQDRDWLLDMRREMGDKLHHEELASGSLAWDEAGLPGKGGVKLIGAWAGQKFQGGGPFWCYFLADPASGRVYCIDLLVYAPGMDKMPLFRRLEAVATTFSTTRPQP